MVRHFKEVVLQQVIDNAVTRWLGERRSGGGKRRLSPWSCPACGPRLGSELKRHGHYLRRPLVCEGTVTLRRGALGTEFLPFARLSFHLVDGRSVCMIRVLPGTKPAWLTDSGVQQFYARVNNTTQPFTPSEAASYIQNHWA